MPHCLRQPRLQKYRNYTYTAFLRHFCSILTDFPIAQKPGILYAYHTLTLNCPYKISRQCSHFCRSRVQKCQNNVFMAFCSILTNFQMTHRPEISYLHMILIRVCSRKISSQCCIFFWSHVQKRHFYSILTAFFQKALCERFHYFYFQFPTDVSYTKPLRNPGYSHL